MKNKVFHFNSVFKAKESDNGSLKIVGYASTSDKDRVGDVILPDAWTKSDGIGNYQKNPIVLFNHNYDKPIGRVSSINVDDKGLEVEADISDADISTQKLIRDGVLSTFSVGFGIKDADYIRETDGLLIKDVELYEISVVSVPCNQDAVFSLAKSFDSDKEFKTYIKQLVPTAELPAEPSANAQDSADDKAKGAEGADNEEIEMTKEELEKLLKETAAATAKQISDDAKKASDDAKKAEDAKAAEDKEFTIKVTTAAEKLLIDIEDKFSKDNESLKSIVDELKEDLVSKSAEIEAIRNSKVKFGDRGNREDWKKQFEQDIVDSKILGIATGKGWNTKTAQDLIKAVSTTSGVEVSSEDFEQVVSTNLERDIELQLVLAPLFRTLSMTSNTMTMPIMPDAGYAEFVARGGLGDQTAPKGNLDMRSATFGDNAGVDLGERTVTTNKLISTSYLGNETQEDAILPILPLIRESMIRSHARSIEQSLLLGNSAQGVYTSGIYDGLTEMAVDASTNLDDGASGYAATDAVTAKDLFTLRKSMGKYGHRPDDVVYIVSLDAYYNLIEDAEFEDVNLVGSAATKLRGEVGQVYGTRVIVCDEFPAKAADAYNAVCVNVRNYLRPVLRGIRLESQYLVKEQHNVLVATQRVGFIDIIEDAASVASFAYKGA